MVVMVCVSVEGVNGLMMIMMGNKGILLKGFFMEIDYDLTLELPHFCLTEAKMRQF